MNSKKLYLILLSLLAVLGIGIIAGVYEVDALLQQQSKVLVDKKAESAALDTKQEQLIRDKKDIKKYEDLNQIAKAIVPQDKDQAEAIRQIVKIAHQSDIANIGSITFPTSTLGGTATGTSRALRLTKSNLTQLTPVKGITGVYTLPITVSVTQDNAVSYSSFIKFLSNLEKNRRTAQVSSMTVSPLPKNPSHVSFTLVIDEYIKP